MQVGVLDDLTKCELEGCEASSFLPATCTNCKRTFCPDHIFSSAHNCPCTYDARLLTCPICNAVVDTLPGQSADAAVSMHIDQGCPPPRGLKGSNSSLRPLTGNSRRGLDGKYASHVHCLGSAKSGDVINPVPYDARVKRISVPTHPRVAQPFPSSQGLKKLVSLSQIMEMTPGNTLPQAIGRPLGVAVEKSGEEVWAPLVYTLVYPTLTAVTPSSSDVPQLSSEMGSEAAHGHSSHHCTLLPIPPLYVYVKVKKFVLGKVLDIVVEALKLRYDFFSPLSEKESLLPKYLFVVPQKPPVGATEAMYPPQTLSCLAYKVLTGPSQKETSGCPPPSHSRFVCFISNSPSLPKGVLSAMRKHIRQERSQCAVA